MYSMLLLIDGFVCALYSVLLLIDGFVCALYSVLLLIDGFVLYTETQESCMHKQRCM